MDAFDVKDYRKFINEAVERQKKETRSLTFTKLASAIGIQRSQLSQALSGSYHLTADQLFLVCQQLGLDEMRTQYLMLLRESELTTLPSRREKLSQQMKQLKNEGRKTEEYLQAAIEKSPLENSAMTRYVSRVIYPLAHMLLLCDDYRNSPTRLGKRLQLSPDELADILSTLSKCGYISVTAKGLRVLNENTHIPRDNPLAHINNLNFRLNTIQQMSRRDARDYFFTGTFCADEECFLWLKGQCLEFIKRASAQIAKSPSSDVFQINLDLLRPV